LEHLRKEAKAVFAAQKASRIDGCRQLRLLGRLSKLGEGELLAADVSLQDAQMAVALDYGFPSWAALKQAVEAASAEKADASRDSGRDSSVCARAGRLFKQLQNDPLYQRSQIWALMVAMRAMGHDDADYCDLMAISGWAGQFIYSAKPDGPTFIEPGPTVSRACAAMGFALDQARPGSADEAFDYILQACAADQLVLGEHLEFGLFVGFDGSDEPKLRYVVCPFFNDGVWWTREQFAQTWWDGAPGDKRLFRLTGLVAPKDPAAVAVETLHELVRLATENYWTDWRKRAAPNATTGLRGIEQYAADLADVSRSMQDENESNSQTCFFDRGWGCYAIYPQWTARECSARYLDGLAGRYAGAAQAHIRQAARGYRAAYRAWQHWAQHLGRVSGGNDAYDRHWADPDHRRAGSEAVREALDHERRAVGSVERALNAMPDPADT
jgi:hypothetical protein